MLGAGILVGSVGYMVTTPFHLIKTRIQADRAAAMTSQHTGKKLSVYTTADLTTSFARILKEEGFASLFKGMGPLTCRGALFTSGQMMGYDGFKTLAKTYYDIQDGPYLHLCASVAASFGASFLSAPADLIMAQYMVSRQKTTVTSCIQSVYRQNGIAGFWRGWSLFFVRLTPILFTFTTVYEQLRFQLGLGYMS
jgi:dicarboxylate transporter 10